MPEIYLNGPDDEPQYVKRLRLPNPNAATQRQARRDGRVMAALVGAASLGVLGLSLGVLAQAHDSPSDGTLPPIAPTTTIQVQLGDYGVGNPTPAQVAACPGRVTYTEAIDHWTCER